METTSQKTTSCSVEVLRVSALLKAYVFRMKKKKKRFLAVKNIIGPLGT